MRRKIKIFRTNNGLEYLSTNFNELCKKESIARHRTVKKTPQQNGLAERMDMIIMERVRCMLSTSGLFKPFWAEVSNTIVYLINRCPSSAINFEAP